MNQKWIYHLCSCETETNEHKHRNVLTKQSMKPFQILRRCSEHKRASVSACNSSVDKTSDPQIGHPFLGRMLCAFGPGLQPMRSNAGRLRLVRSATPESVRQLVQRSAFRQASRKKKTHLFEANAFSILFCCQLMALEKKL